MTEISKTCFDIIHSDTDSHAHGKSSKKICEEEVTKIIIHNYLMAFYLD